MEEYAPQLDTEGQRIVSVVREGTRKMAQMIDDILAFSRAGRQEIAPAEVDMEESVRAALKDLEPAVAGRNIKLDIQPLPASHGDAPMLRRVWTNLLDNAIKFTRHQPDAVIEVGARAGEGETVYYVKDNGVGFDMQYSNKLFGVFQRLHGQNEFPGTGIGLAIVKRIVARHGGRVWAEGKVGQGATLYFALPNGG
jgi:two-component system sensor kinase